MSDLSQLFPDLARQLENWDGTATPPEPSDAQVTDDQIEGYLRQMGALRAPLNPAVSGQTVPPTPEFVNNGRAVPPGGQATVEPPAQETGGTEQVEGAPPAAPPPPSPTTPPATPPTTPDYYDIAGRRYDRAQAEAWAQFDDLVSGDSELRNIIQQHLQRRAGGVTPPPPAPAPLPELPPEYRDDPFFTALHARLQEQQDTLDRVSRQSQYAAETANSNVQRTYTDIAQGVMTEFKTSHNLDDRTMAAVAKAAHSTGYAEKYMSGIDPLTGAPVKPDPYEAVRTALQAGYFLAPETRLLETQREVARVVERDAADAARKQKLAGVSGAAGSVPRTQPPPTNPNDMRAAAIEDVRQMLDGSWTGDGS